VQTTVDQRRDDLTRWHRGKLLAVGDGQDVLAVVLRELIGRAQGNASGIPRSPVCTARPTASLEGEWEHGKIAERDADTTASDLKGSRRPCFTVTFTLLKLSPG
jgi:hypothetical protein